MLKHTTRQLKARITCISHRININTLAQEPANDLAMNGIALVQLETTTPLFFDPYALNRATGSFILLDPLSNATVGAGMIREDLSDQQVLNGQPVSATEKAARHGHRPGLFLLPNRASLSDTVERVLFEHGFATMIMDVDQIPSAYLPTLIALLWSAGLIVLLVIDKPSRELVDALEPIAGGSLFDVAPDSAFKSREEIVAQIVSQAETLRIGGPPDQSEKAPASV